jgi:peroxin-5
MGEEEEPPLNYIKESLFLKDNPFLGINEDSTLEKDLIETSNNYLNKGDTMNARFALEAEINKNPDNSEAWHLLGKIHTENDRDDFAMQCFLKALEVDPFNANALLALGISCTNEFDEFDAMKYLKNWIKLHHIYNKYLDNNNLLLNYELIEYEMEHDRDDEDYYQKAKRIEGLKLNFFNEMCNLMENIALNEKKQDSDLWIALGIAHFIPSHNERAIECFRKAVEINPKDYSAWNKLGAILAHSKMDQEAINTYKNALQLNPKYARCWTNLGIAYMNINNYEESMLAFLSALKIYKDIPQVWSYLSSVAITLQKMDDYELAHNRNLDALLFKYKV